MNVSQKGKVVLKSQSGKKSDRKFGSFADAVRIAVTDENTRFLSAVRDMYRSDDFARKAKEGR